MDLVNICLYTQSNTLDSIRANNFSEEAPVEETTAN